MFNVFQKWARVKKVFISRKLNKWGRKFGFLIFFDVRNVGSMERELDQIYIGNMKLFVNIPKYRRHHLEPNRAERRESRTINTVRPRNYGKKHLEAPALNKKKRRKKVWVEKKGKKKSFVDVVKGETQWK